MSWINDITPENFNASFALNNILINSIFYANAGLDAADIENYRGRAISFVHSDENVTESEVRQGMSEHFTKVGYNALTQNLYFPWSKFALCSIFILKSDANHYSDGTKKMQIFLLLHICANHRIVFTNLYEQSNIKPLDCFVKLSM